LIWFRIGIGGGLLWIRSWTFGFHKTPEIPWLAADLLVSQEGLCFMELVKNLGIAVPTMLFFFIYDKQYLQLQDLQPDT
jgi:hypothetical protein